MTAMVKAEGVHKSFGLRRRPQGHRPGGRSARGVLPDRPVRLRQVDLPAVHQPPGADQRRPAVGRRRAGRLPPEGRQALRAQGQRGRGQAPGHRHGLPALQPLPAHDGHRERHGGADPGQGRVQGRGARQRAERLLDRVGLADKARQLPLPAVRRPAAARGHRPRAGDGAEADALRRAHLGARPGAGRRRPRRHARPGRGRA